MLHRAYGAVTSLPTNAPDFRTPRSPRADGPLRRLRARDGGAEQAGAGEGKDGKRRGGKTGSARPPEGSGPGLYGETGNSTRYTRTHTALVVPVICARSADVEDDGGAGEGGEFRSAHMFVV